MKLKSKSESFQLLKSLLNEKRLLTGFLLATLALILMIVMPSLTDYRSDPIRELLINKIDPLSLISDKIPELVLMERSSVRGLLAVGDGRFITKHQGEDQDIVVVEVYQNFKQSQIDDFKKANHELGEAIRMARPLAAACGEDTKGLFEETISLAEEYSNLLQSQLELYKQNQARDARRQLASGEGTDVFNSFLQKSGQLVMHIEMKRTQLRVQLEQFNSLDTYFTNSMGLVGIGLLSYILLLSTRSASLLKETAAQKQVLEEQSEELAKANKIKDEFLATLSHELRTPLTPILGWITILKKKLGSERVDTDLKQALETIERNTKIQVQLINDLLDLSRITNRKMTLNKELLNFNEAIQAAVETVHEMAAAKEIRIHQDLYIRELPIEADSVRIQQVVWNLLTNAIRYNTKGGEIFIKTELIDDNAKLTVKDTGIGIKPEFLPHMFEIFSQADTGTTRKQGGLGIGLSVVKSLVEMHGGKIAVYSEGKDSGSTFTIHLPLSENRPAIPVENIENEKVKHLFSLRVLVIEDSQDARNVLVAALKGRSCSVFIAEDAEQGFQIAVRERPDLIISDIGLPGQDGYTFISRIRSNSELQHIPAIAVTGYGMAEDKKKAKEAGFDAYILKPIDYNSLFREMNDIVTKRSLC